MTVQDLINTVGVQKFGVTGPDYGQCTAIAHKWEQILGLPIIYGDAAQTYDAAPVSLYDKELNQSNNFPRPGAIVVWKAFGGHGMGAAGHTAVCTNADANNLFTFDQNWPTGSGPLQMHHDYQGVLGWFYPKVLGNNQSGGSSMTIEEVTRIAETRRVQLEEQAKTISGLLARVDEVTQIAETRRGQLDDLQKQIDALKAQLGTQTGVDPSSIVITTKGWQALFDALRSFFNTNK